MTDNTNAALRPDLFRKGKIVLSSDKQTIGEVVRLDEERNGLIVVRGRFGLLEELLLPLEWIFIVWEDQVLLRIGFWDALEQAKPVRFFIQLPQWFRWLPFRSA